MYPDWESNPWPFHAQDDSLTIKPHWLGLSDFFFKVSKQLVGEIKKSISFVLFFYNIKVSSDDKEDAL